MSRASEPLRKLVRHAEWTGAKRGHRTYQLKDGPEIFATLAFPKLFGSLAEGRAAEGQWTFKRGGFLRPHVTIRRAGTEQDVGIFQARWTGDGVLELEDGQRYVWTSTGFWRTRRIWSDAHGAELLVFEPTSLLRTTARVELVRTPGKSTPLGLLATLGWYLILLAAQDAASAAVIS